MKVTRWVDFGAEVDILIDFNDIRAAMSEAFDNVTKDRLGEEAPTKFDIERAINTCGGFINALTDEMIAKLSPKGREIVASSFAKAAARFAAAAKPAEPTEAV